MLFLFGFALIQFNYALCQFRYVLFSLCALLIFCSSYALFVCALRMSSCMYCLHVLFVFAFFIGSFHLLFLCTWILCKCLMEEAGYFSKFGNLRRCQLLEMGGNSFLKKQKFLPTPLYPRFIYRKEFIFKLQSRNFMGQNQDYLMHYERFFLISPESEQVTKRAACNL